MRARYEDGDLLVDFSLYGWNPDKVIDMRDEQFERFEQVCNQDYDGFEDMELSDLVDVIITMTVDGDIK